MNEMKFNEEDKQRFLEFLNVTAKSAKFDFNTTEIINYFKLLSHMQQKILPKIDANILEIKRIVDTPITPIETSTIIPEKSSKKGKG